MTVPDELVQAAALAPCTHEGMFGGPCSAAGGWKHPECALQAAFAKLGECKTVRCGADLYGEDYRVLPTCHCGWEGEWVRTYDEAADAYAAHRLAALAREFGGQE